MSLEQLVTAYGYAAVGIGCFFEGEAILIVGGFAAHRGYLELPWVIVNAFIGTLASDQIFYFIGRIKGPRVLEKRPAWKAKSEKVFPLLRKHQNLLIIGFRFIYGFRTVTPFLIGASRIEPGRYAILNIVGAALWAVVIGVLGYLFGYALEALVDNVKKYELLIFSALVVVGIIHWLTLFRKKFPSVKSIQAKSKKGDEINK